jgi:hypothetical protein
MGQHSFRGAASRGKALPSPVGHDRTDLEMSGPFCAALSARSAVVLCRVGDSAMVRQCADFGEVLRLLRGEAARHNGSR